jgi:hypothetical protein
MRRGESADRVVPVIVGFALLGAFGALAAASGRGPRFTCPSCSLQI